MVARSACVVRADTDVEVEVLAEKRKVKVRLDNSQSLN